MQLETLDESLNELIIPKTGRDLKGVFSHFNANLSHLQWYQNHRIEVKNEKIYFFGPPYSFCHHQFKVIHEYIHENSVTEFICFLKSLVRAFILFNHKSNDTLQLYVYFLRLNAIGIRKLTSFSVHYWVIRPFNWCSSIYKNETKNVSIVFKCEKMTKEKQFFRKDKTIWVPAEVTRMMF